MLEMALNLEKSGHADPGGQRELEEPNPTPVALIHTTAMLSAWEGGARWMRGAPRTCS